MNFFPSRRWLAARNTGPVVIAGPCSAESEVQMHTIGRQVAAHPYVRVLRAGIWKPRTRPDTFSGVGTAGLTWLVDAARENGLLSATEVANQHHVEAALKAGVDVLWIGARTTVSPFAVQEIADALKGTNVSVMVKNPINPDLMLWLGAIERLNKAGLQKVAAIHRGFSWFDKTIYRNEPKWSIAVQLKTEIPDLDIFCDPSHIAGDPSLIPAIAQRALDLDMTGLMIESHPNPEEALSDSEQQITPESLANILNNLVLKTTTSKNLEFTNRLEALRADIDTIDFAWMESLAQRIGIVDQIGQYKKENHVTVLQLKRWEEILTTRKEWAKELGLSQDFIKDLLQIIHQESLRLQTDIMNKPERTNRKASKKA